MEILQIQLRNHQSVEVGVVGPEHGRPVLYFHSPAAAGEEMRDAAIAAAETGIRLVSIRRPSVSCSDPRDFVAAVAKIADVVVDELELGQPAVLGWSGGAPYAIATATHVGARISAVHLVSPVPGPLTGSDALADQSERLREVAHSTASSAWISGPAALRDYHAVAAPWPFEIQPITQDITIWSPADDDVVPPHLLKALAQKWTNVTVIDVAGTHGWLAENWLTVLECV